MKTYAIWNVKGGVGKTITAINLAVGLAAKGKRVLLVDFDGQSSVTYQLFPHREFGEEDKTIVNALSGEAELKDCIYPTAIKNLDVSPTTLFLFTVDKRMLTDTTSVQQTKLKKLLRTVKNIYDYVVIDTNPSLTLSVTNALCACDHLIIPADMEKGALKGVEISLDYSNDIITGIDGTAFDVRILPTKFGRIKADSITLYELMNKYSGMLTKSLIRKQETVIRNANEKNKPVIHYTSKKNMVCTVSSPMKERNKIMKLSLKRVRKMMRSERNAVLVSTDTVGERIKKARVARNITQTELSKRIGTVYQRIHEWEAAWKNPSDKYLDKIAEALNVDSEWLKSGVLSKEPYCVFKHFYSADDDCITEETFEIYKNNLAKVTEHLVNVSAKTFTNNGISNNNYLEITALDKN